MKNIDNQVYQGQRNTAPCEKNKKRGIDMINNNNEFYQNSMINARKDNDEWKNAAGTCSPELIKKNITENGTYNASDDGADGYSSVKVNVPSAPTPETFEVEMTLSDMEITSSSKTYAEVITALNENKVLSISLDTGETVVLSDGYVLVDGTIVALFHLPNPYNNIVINILWNNPQVYTTEFMAGMTQRA